MPSSPLTVRESTEDAELALAKALAPEEIRAGDFVTPLYVVAEVPSYWWCGESWELPRDEPVRIRFTPTTDGVPLRVKSVCLPFVLVKCPGGAAGMIDTRKCQLARLDDPHARRAWKALKRAARKVSRV